jgi:hypothetical protein
LPVAPAPPPPPKPPTRKQLEARIKELEATVAALSSERNHEPREPA